MDLTVAILAVTTVVSTSLSVLVLLLWLRYARASRQKARLEADFVAFAFHELRNPVNGVAGYLEFMDAALDEALACSEDEHKTMRSSTLSPTTSVHRTNVHQHLVTTRQDCRMAVAACRHAVDVLNHVLDLGKILEGKMELMREPTDINEVCETALTVSRRIKRSLNLKLSMDIKHKEMLSEEGRLIVYGDARRLRQILINLVSNSVKFTEKGTVEIRVTADLDDPPPEPSLHADGSESSTTISDIVTFPAERERVRSRTPSRPAATGDGHHAVSIPVVRTHTVSSKGPVVRTQTISSKGSIPVPRTHTISAHSARTHTFSSRGMQRTRTVSSKGPGNVNRQGWINRGVRTKNSKKNIISSGMRDGKECWIKIEVLDTGPGISREVQSQLFSKYKQADAKKVGTGLGLLLSQQFAKLMDSEIKIQSPWSPTCSGTNFYFIVKLPLCAETVSSVPDLDARSFHPPSVLSSSQGDHDVNRLQLAKMKPILAPYMDDSDVSPPLTAEEAEARGGGRLRRVDTAPLHIAATDHSHSMRRSQTLTRYGVRLGRRSPVRDHTNAALSAGRLIPRLTSVRRDAVASRSADSPYVCPPRFLEPAAMSPLVTSAQAPAERHSSPADVTEEETLALAHSLPHMTTVDEETGSIMSVSRPTSSAVHNTSTSPPSSVGPRPSLADRVDSVASIAASVTTVHHDVSVQSLARSRLAMLASQASGSLSSPETRQRKMDAAAISVPLTEVLPSAENIPKRSHSSDAVVAPRSPSARLPPLRGPQPALRGQSIQSIALSRVPKPTTLLSSATIAGAAAATGHTTDTLLRPSVSGNDTPVKSPLSDASSNTTVCVPTPPSAPLAVRRSSRRRRKLRQRTDNAGTGDPDLSDSVSPAVSSENLTPAPGPMDGWRVLVSDDVRINRRLLIRKFERSKPFAALAWNCLGVEKSEDALSAVEQILQPAALNDHNASTSSSPTGSGPFRLVILDEHTASDMRGSQCAQRIRQLEQQCKIPPRKRCLIVSYTGDANDPKEVDRLKSCGVDMVWSKPLPTNEVLVKQLRDTLAERTAAS